MEDTKSRMKAFLEPKTLAGTMAVAAVGYVLCQPAFQLGMHAVFGDPLPFATRAEWGRFIVVCAALGAAVGLVWWQAARLPRRSLLKAWVRSSATMLPMSVMLSADRFSRDPLVTWLVTRVVIASFLGAAYIPLYRLWDGDETPPQQPRSGAA